MYLVDQRFDFDRRKDLLKAIAVRRRYPSRAAASARPEMHGQTLDQVVSRREIPGWKKQIHRPIRTWQRLEYFVPPFTLPLRMAGRVGKSASCGRTGAGDHCSAAGRQDWPRRATLSGLVAWAAMWTDRSPR